MILDMECKESGYLCTILLCFVLVIEGYTLAHKLVFFFFFFGAYHKPR